ncbi:hypothetical protein CsSME_00022981 [Camellia sinensis var. sinensis]
MMLRASISNTKKFFQKTLKSFKSFLSSDYQRLPKSPPFNPFPTQSNQELDKFYIDFTDRWDSDNDKAKAKKRKKKKEKEMNLPRANSEKEVFSGSLTKIAKSGSKKNREEEMVEEKDKNKRLVCEGKRKEEYLTSCSNGKKEVRTCLVAQKIKELEMVDKSNIEHVLDIEEVLHYYSRLTCPAYVDIVDKFFMDMYAELSSLQAMAHDTQIQGR